MLESCIRQPMRCNRVYVILAAVVAFAASAALGAGALNPLSSPVFDADLENPWHVAVSPNRRHIYATSQWRGGALVAFRRNTSTSRPEYLYTLKDGEEGVDGLAYPNGIIISDNGKFVYVASGGDNAVAVFSRNTSSGVLTFLETKRGGDTWTGLVGCFAVALSPDQRYLYACGVNDNTLAVFSVNTSSGRLTFVDGYRNNANGLSNFRGPRSIAVTPNGKQVLVTAESSNRLFIFTRSTSTGKLTLSKAWANGAEGLTHLASPWQVVVSDDGLNAYIACAGSWLIVLGRTSATKSFTVLEQHGGGFPDDRLGGLRYLALSPPPAEDRLYASARDSSALTVYARDPDTGGLARLAQVRQWFAGLQHFVWPHQVAISSDGGSAFVVTGDDALHRFELRGDGGEISWDFVVFGEPDRIQGLRGCQRLCMSSDGLNVYVPAADEENLITCFKRDRSRGTLTHIQTMGAWEDWYPVDCLSYVTQIIAAPNKRDIYACSLGNDAIAHFYRDDADDPLILQAAYYNNCGISDMVDPWGLTLSPDKDHLYAVAYSSDSIVFMDVASDGSLAFKQSFVNGTSGCTQLDGPTSVCLPRDGKYVYVTAARKNAVVIFTRDRSRGNLTYKSYESTGPSPIYALVSPDSAGKHVYVLASGQIACYSRNSSTGALTLIDTCATVGGPGIDMALDSTGKYLYVPFEGSDTVAVYERNTSTGLLTLQDSKTNGSSPGEVYSLDGPRSLVLDPDDKHFYVGCTGDMCLRIFSTSN